MQYQQRRSFLALIGVLALVSQGCATKVPVNAAGHTALQKVIVYNAALAKANRNLEQGVEKVQTSGLITAAQARPIILATGRIAKASSDVLAITSKGSEATWSVDGPRVVALLQDIAPANVLTGVGVTDQSVQALLSALTDAINAVTAAAKGAN